MSLPTLSDMKCFARHLPCLVLLGRADNTYVLSKWILSGDEGYTYEMHVGQPIGLHGGGKGV